MLGATTSAVPDFPCLAGVLPPLTTSGAGASSASVVLFEEELEDFDASGLDETSSEKETSLSDARLFAAEVGVEELGKEANGFAEVETGEGFAVPEAEVGGVTMGAETISAGSVSGLFACP